MGPHNITDLKLTKVSNLDIDKEIEKDLSLCTDMYMDDTATSMLYPIIKNRLNILQEYIPGNYSTKFRNPCWFDFYHIPSSPLIQTPDCLFPGLNDTVQARKVLEHVKTSRTRHMYCLPAFFVPGFAKSATTTLHQMIIKHPLVAQSRCKGGRFWLEFVSQKKGTQLEKRIHPLHYLETFSQSKRTIESNPLSITLDATPLYMQSLDKTFCLLPVLLTHVLPEAKFIVIMRNPTIRYISHYWFITVRDLRETYNNNDLRQYVHSKEALEVFHNHTVDAIMQFQACVDENSVFHCIIKEDKENNVRIIEEDKENSVRLQYSLYYYHIVPWLKVIPRERFLFLRTEDLVHDPSLTMSKVWHFLHLYDLPITEKMSYNVNLEVKDLKIPSQTKKLLDKFYQPYNQLLAGLLADTRYLWND